MSSEKFDRLLGVMAELRAPGGCPWDREQTVESLRRYLIEECYEVLDAIDRGDWTALAEELGDVQLQIVFQSQIASERGWFTIDDVLDHINDKLIRRHPHVFGTESAETAGDVLHRWEEIKADEKRRQGASPAHLGGSLLGEIANSQPAMLEAREIGKRAAKAGLDWKGEDDLADRIVTETGYFRAGQRGKDPADAEVQVGDLLFLVVALARRFRVDPELALRAANRRFRERFRALEERLGQRDKSIEALDGHEKERLWREVEAE